MVIFKNNKTRNRRQRLFPSKISIQVQLEVLYMEVSGRTSSLLWYSCMMPKTTNIEQWWDTTHATEAPPTIDLPSSRSFGVHWWQAIYWAMSNCLVWCSSVPHWHKQFSRTVSSNRVQRSLAVEALNHWTTCKDHASVSYVQFKGR